MVRSQVRPAAHCVWSKPNNTFYRRDSTAGKCVAWQSEVCLEKQKFLDLRIDFLSKESQYEKLMHEILFTLNRNHYYT